MVGFPDLKLQRFGVSGLSLDFLAQKLGSLAGSTSIEICMAMLGFPTPSTESKSLCRA